MRATAVLPVVSIAGFEIVLGAAILSMIVLRVKPRWPPIWLPISLFILGTVISWLASGDLRGGLPQIKKFGTAILLSGPGSQMLGPTLFNFYDSGGISLVSALAMTQVVIVLAAIALMRRLSGRWIEI